MTNPRARLSAARHSSTNDGLSLETLKPAAMTVLRFRYLQRCWRLRDFGEDGEGQVPVLNDTRFTR